MKIQCTFCGFEKETAADLTGKTVRCPKCSREFVVGTNEPDDFVVVEPSTQPSPQEVKVEEVELGKIGYLTVTNCRVYGRISEPDGFQNVDASLENVTAFNVQHAGNPILAKLFLILAPVVFLVSIAGFQAHESIGISVLVLGFLLLGFSFFLWPRLYLELVIGGRLYGIQYGLGDLPKAEAAHQLLLDAKYGKKVKNDSPTGDNENITISPSVPPAEVKPDVEEKVPASTVQHAGNPILALFLVFGIMAFIIFIIVVCN